VYPEDENRLTPRQPYDQVLSLERNHFFTGDNTTLFQIGQTIDISSQGMGIQTETPLQPKETIRIYLPVQAVEIPLPVFSEVRWVKTHNQKYRAGLQFMR
jgi:hypothetical protein